MFEEFYDLDGNCLASERVRRPPKPWTVRQSSSKQGRWYFFNPETNATSWGLKPWWNNEVEEHVLAGVADLEVTTVEAGNALQEPDVNEGGGSVTAEAEAQQAGQPCEGSAEINDDASGSARGRNERGEVRDEKSERGVAGDDDDSGQSSGAASGNAVAAAEESAVAPRSPVSASVSFESSTAFPPIPLSGDGSSFEAARGGGGGDVGVAAQSAGTNDVTLGIEEKEETGGVNDVDNDKKKEDDDDEGKEKEKEDQETSTTFLPEINTAKQAAAPLQPLQEGLQQRRRSSIRRSLKMEDPKNRDAFQRKTERRASQAAAAVPLGMKPNDLFVVGGLGMGGFGVVVQVEHATTGKNYAMKCIAKESCQKPKDRKSLKAELRVLSEISYSPFLLRCHLAFESPTTMNFVTDLVEGGDLFYHLEHLRLTEGQEGFKEEDGKVILAELVLSLIHLHKHNFVHRDLKIENCMITASGHVKLIDFGLAVELDNDLCLLSPAECFLYLPPELLKPGARTRGGVGGRHTDWWALGVLAYEVLTGVSKWNEMVESAVRAEILQLSTNPEASGVSHDAGCFVLHLLRRNYKERLGTAADEDVMGDRFFEGVDWEAMAQGKTLPGYIPDQNAAGRTSSSFDSSGGGSGSSHRRGGGGGGMTSLDPEEAETALNKYRQMKSDTTLVDPILERTGEGRRMSWGSIGLNMVTENPGFERPGTFTSATTRRNSLSLSSPTSPSSLSPSSGASKRRGGSIMPNAAIFAIAEMEN